MWTSQHWTWLGASFPRSLRIAESTASKSVARPTRRAIGEAARIVGMIRRRRPRSRGLSRLCLSVGLILQAKYCGACATSDVGYESIAEASRLRSSRTRDGSRDRNKLAKSYGNCCMAEELAQTASPTARDRLPLY